MRSLGHTSFQFPFQKKKITGKVRELYLVKDKLVMIATDRISAFDKILPNYIPYKGQVLNQIAFHSLNATSDIISNWVESCPHPNVTIGKHCEPFKVEMVVRGYLVGHAWREYQSGKRKICGNVIPDGMRENEKFIAPLLTPTTKSENGHDGDVSKSEILDQGWMNEHDYNYVEKCALKLFERGTALAHKKGLILVDTKYEFGKYHGNIMLIDEVHTPDSSRYFYSHAYDECFIQNKPQKHLSKEFVRQWLLKNDFNGNDNQKIPTLTTEKIKEISNRYIDLYESLIGEAFVRDMYQDKIKRIKKSIIQNI